MSNRSLVLLAAAVVFLGLFIWFFERHEPTTEEASAQEKKVYPDLENEDIRGLEIENNNGHFIFARTDSGWRLTDPITGAADAMTVDGVVSSLLRLQIDRTLAPDEVEGDAYGLEAPELVVTLITQNGEKHRLLIGGTTPLGGKRAISRGDREIILTSGAFAAELDKGLDDWRSRELVEARLADLAAIEINTRGDTIDAYQVGGEWRLRSPIEDLADSELLRTFVTDITSVRIEQFLDSDPDLDGLGLDPPRHHIVMVPADGGAGTILDFGSKREVDGATQVVCRRNGVDYFWVNNRAETVLGKAPVLWREPRVRPFETWDITSIEIVRDADSTHLNRSTGMWTFEDGQVAEASAVQELLSALAGLEAVDFDLMNLGTAEIGRVTLGRGETDETATTFWFQRPLAEGGNVLVRASGRETLMSVHPEDVDAIFASVDSLRPPPPEPADDSGPETIEE